MKKLVFSLVLLCGATVSVQGFAAGALTDEQKLQQQLVQAQQADGQPTQSFKLTDAIEAVASAQSLTAAAPTCKETKRLTFAGRYIVSYNDAGPCRIYDMSFPTLRSVGQRIGRLPVQKFTAHDYLNWIEGNYADVYKTVDTFKGNFTQSDLQGSWVSTLRFKSGAVAGRSLVGGVPTSFRASDLDVGNNFGFDAATKAALQSMVNTQRSLIAASNDPNDVAMNTFLQDSINNPSKLLAAIKFNWNAAEKVFDIVLDGQFLPINGPVVLVDYNQQYKVFIETETRSIVSSVVQKLVSGFAPAGSTGSILKVAIAEAFSMIDETYTYQMNRLEDTLRMAVVGEMAAGDVPMQDLEKGLDVLYGSRGNLLQGYILAKVQHKTFDFTDMATPGRDDRYAAEKSRVIEANNMHSQLVLKNKCDVTNFEENFGICTRQGKQIGVYTLMSSTTILFWNLGPMRVYNFANPAETSLRRGVSLLMADGLEVIPLPIPGFLTSKLSSSLRTFALAGQDDEAYLLNRLAVQQGQAGSLSADDQSMLKWLYIQNLNPFTPKSATSEAAVVQANTTVLEHQQ